MIALADRHSLPPGHGHAGVQFFNIFQAETLSFRHAKYDEKDKEKNDHTEQPKHSKSLKNFLKNISKLES